VSFIWQFKAEKIVQLTSAPTVNGAKLSISAMGGKVSPPQTHCPKVRGCSNML
jgi:hypothetical protein